MKEDYPRFPDIHDLHIEFEDQQKIMVSLVTYFITETASKSGSVNQFFYSTKFLNSESCIVSILRQWGPVRIKFRQATWPLNSNIIVSWNGDGWHNDWFNTVRDMAYFSKCEKTLFKIEVNGQRGCSACQTRKLAVPGSIPALFTCWSSRVHVLGHSCK